MKGSRKLIIAVVFLTCGTFIGWSGIRAGSDLVGIATIIGAIAGGVLTIVWGNSQEHKADASTKIAEAK